MKKKPNNSNVLFNNIYDYKRVFYNIGRFFHNLKYAKQRIVRGYADCDLWNFDMYLYSVLQNGINSLADVSSGYPEPFETLDDWKSELRRVSSLISDIDIHNGIDKCFDDNGEFSSVKYKELSKYTDDCKAEALDWLKNHIDSLWD